MTDVVDYQLILKDEDKGSSDEPISRLIINLKDLEGLEVSVNENISISEKLFLQGVCLPSDTKMTEEDLARICRIIRGLWK